MLCQLTSASQSAFIFFSSLSITLIAIDRYLLIICPHKTQISTNQVSVRVKKTTKSLVDNLGFLSVRCCSLTVGCILYSTIYLHQARGLVS